MSENCINQNKELVKTEKYDPAAGLPLLLQHCARQVVIGVLKVSDGDLRGATRGRAPIAFARQVAMYLTHIAGGLSLTEVGTMFARDRTTVAHACATIEDHRDDRDFDLALDLLESAICARLAGCAMAVAEDWPGEWPGDWRRDWRRDWPHARSMDWAGAGAGRSRGRPARDHVETPA